MTSAVADDSGRHLSNTCARRSGPCEKYPPVMIFPSKMTENGFVPVARISRRISRYRFGADRCPPGRAYRLDLIAATVAGSAMSMTLGRDDLCAQCTRSRGYAGSNGQRSSSEGHLDEAGLGAPR